MVKQALKASPVAALPVGTQILSQKKIEELMREKIPGLKKGPYATVYSTATVAVLLTHPYVIFQGITNTPYMSPSESLRELTWAQARYLVKREVFFLGGVACAEPAAAAVKDQTDGDETAQAVAPFAARFTSGYLGTLMSYPFDTALRLLQNNMPLPKLTEPKKWMAGGPRKALALGIFSMFLGPAIEVIQTSE